MTAKRFTMIYFETDGNLIFDETKHNGEWYNSAECLQDNEIVELLNVLHEENEQLKQRNDRQAKQLDRLYQLISEKDWRTLTDIMDDFKKAEEQLQREWRTYK